MAKPKNSVEVDKIIGQRIQELRIVMGMSRHELAKKIGVTHQQTQKYERGINRISAGRLASIAAVLGKPVAYFFNDNIDDLHLPNEHRRMCIEISRNFLRIKNAANREAINILVRTLANEEAA